MAYSLFANEKVREMKQPVLKPQDLLVALKLCVLANLPSYSDLAGQLVMSVSEAHAAVKRARLSLLLTPDETNIEPNRNSIREFLIHGVKYCFPLTMGGLARGYPTGASAPPLSLRFGETNALPLVWPHETGTVRGIAVVPIYPTVPAACKADPKLHGLMAVADALRGGAAREREIAKDILESVLR